VKQTRILSSLVCASNMRIVSDEVLALSVKAMGSYVCIANVHMVVTAKENELLVAAMEGAAIVTSDGMPLVWTLRKQGLKDAERVSGPDLMVELCEKAQSEKLPIYFYGGSLSVVEAMKEKLVERFPDLIVAGIESPPMLAEKPEVDLSVVEAIKESGAKIVFVGLGCPKQELWMHAYSPHIPAVLIGVGAAFDFFSGTVKRAPLWMQRSGLEWFYRLCSEPRRLWKRYLVTNSLFVYYYCMERVTMVLRKRESRG